MSRRRKLCIGFLSGAAAAVAIALLSMRPNWLYEEWYIHRLQSAEVEQRIQAAEKLGEMQSVRAVPAILEAIQWARQLSDANPPEKLASYIGSPEHFFGAEVWRLKEAIVRMGKPATLEVLRAIGMKGSTDGPLPIPQLILADIYSSDLRYLADQHTGRGSLMEDLLKQIRDAPALSDEVRAAAGEALSRLTASDHPAED
jgi:HEAT repeat protein